MAATQEIILVDAQTITATGQATAVKLPAGARYWVAYLKVASVSGSSPTLDVTVQHSADGSNWVTLIAMTQATGATVEHKFAASATDYLKPLLPYVRASYVVGGTGSPTFTGTTVKLLMDC